LTERVTVGATKAGLSTILIVKELISLNEFLFVPDKEKNNLAAELVLTSFGVDYTMKCKYG